jgi:hypothetical protein
MGSSLWHLVGFKGINDKEHLDHLYIYTFSYISQNGLVAFGHHISESWELVERWCYPRKGEESRGNYGFNGVLVEYWTSKGQHL